MFIRTLAGLVAAAALAAPAQAELQRRVIGIDTLPVDAPDFYNAWYSPELDITIAPGEPWINSENEQVFVLNWYDAMAYADQRDWGGFSDWRLPTIDPTCFAGSPCSTGEFGYLHFVEGLIITGWSAMESAGSPNNALVYDEFGQVHKGYRKETLQTYWTVREGDVLAAPVPEPATFLSLLAGMAVLGWQASARSRRGQS